MKSTSSYKGKIVKIKHFISFLNGLPEEIKEYKIFIQTDPGSMFNESCDITRANMRLSHKYKGLSL